MEILITLSSFWHHHIFNNNNIFLNELSIKYQSELREGYKSIFLQIMNIKNLIFIFLILWIIPMSCQAPTNIKLYYIKIRPIGNSDFPRVTVFISMTNLDSITKLGFPTIRSFTDRILTNEETLRNTVSFISKNNMYKDYPNKKFNEFGCLNVSVYNRKALVTDYDLDRSGSVKYLNSLIAMLINKNLDPELIKELKREVLAPISY